jgi:hypothetical protein
MADIFHLPRRFVPVGSIECSVCGQLTPVNPRSVHRRLCEKCDPVARSADRAAVIADDECLVAERDGSIVCVRGPHRVCRWSPISVADQRKTLDAIARLGALTADDDRTIATARDHHVAVVRVPDLDNPSLYINATETVAAVGDADGQITVTSISRLTVKDALDLAAGLVAVAAGIVAESQVR